MIKIDDSPGNGVVKTNLLAMLVLEYRRDFSIVSRLLILEEPLHRKEDETCHRLLRTNTFLLICIGGEAGWADTVGSSPNRPGNEPTFHA